MAAAQSKTPARGKKKVTLSKPPANEQKTSRTPRRKTTSSKTTAKAPAKKTAAKKTTKKRPVVKKSETASKTTTTAKKAPAKKTAPKASDEKLHRGYIIRYVHTVTEEDGTEVQNLDYITAHNKLHFDIAVQALKESYGLDVDSDKVRVGRIDLLQSECDIWNAIQSDTSEEAPADDSKGKE